MKMIKYIGTKQIAATPMTRAEYNSLRGWMTPPDEVASDQGYLVEYLDGGKGNHPDFAGYISWSPKEPFEKAYRETHGMTFGAAVEAMKIGLKVARAGWNGSGMFAYYSPATIRPAQAAAAVAHWGEGGPIPHRAFMALKTVQGDVAAWSPSGSDALAEDWMVV